MIDSGYQDVRSVLEYVAGIDVYSDGPTGQKTSIFMNKQMLYILKPSLFFSVYALNFQIMHTYAQRYRPRCSGSFELYELLVNTSYMWICVNIFNNI